MKIKVTKEDITNGRKRDPNNCAVALALREAGVTHFGVTGMLVCIAPGPTSVMLPGPVQEWIMDFDRGTPVGPIEFELALPEREPAPAPRPSKTERVEEQGVQQPEASKSQPEPKPRKSCRTRMRVPISAFVRQVVSTVPILNSQGNRGVQAEFHRVADRRHTRKAITVD